MFVMSVSAGETTCTDPTKTVDILTRDFDANEPVTIPKFFEKTFKKWPKVKALCWKDKKEGPRKSLTYIQYKKQIYDVAKSFLKVSIQLYNAVTIAVL